MLFFLVGLIRPMIRVFNSLLEIMISANNWHSSNTARSPITRPYQYDEANGISTSWSLVQYDSGINFVWQVMANRNHPDCWSARCVTKYNVLCMHRGFLRPPSRGLFAWSCQRSSTIAASMRVKQGCCGTINWTAGVIEVSNHWVPYECWTLLFGWTSWFLDVFGFYKL